LLKLQILIDGDECLEFGSGECEKLSVDDTAPLHIGYRSDIVAGQCMLHLAVDALVK